jgi:thiol-disulfide isomerase/thioredoxin
MSASSKIVSISLVIALTLLYSVVEKKKIDALEAEAARPILRELPQFEAQDVYSNQDLNQANLFEGQWKGGFVHFWGTWCAPCEAELPEFVDFAKEFEGQGVKFILLAVNDESLKVKNFLEKRLRDLPKNIVVAIDEDGSSLEKFGTVKVPETYLFEAGTGKTLTKFIGPQDWKLKGFIDRTQKLLSQEPSD